MYIFERVWNYFSWSFSVTTYRYAIRNLSSPTSKSKLSFLLEWGDFMEYVFFLIEIILFAMIQILLTKRARPLESFIIPTVYLVLNLKNIINAFSLRVQLIPDYYLIATLIFPFIELFVIYFIFFYYRQYKKHDNL